LPHVTATLLSFISVFRSWKMMHVVRWRWGRLTRRRGAVTMQKYETSRADRVSPSSSLAARLHRCDLQRLPTSTSDVYWGKMGANQSTRSAPTPGEEGNTVWLTRWRTRESFMSYGYVTRKYWELALDYVRRHTHTHTHTLCSRIQYFMK